MFIWYYIYNAVFSKFKTSTRQYCVTDPKWVNILYQNKKFGDNDYCDNDYTVICS